MVSSTSLLLQVKKRAPQKQEESTDLTVSAFDRLSCHVSMKPNLIP